MSTKSTIYYGDDFHLYNEASDNYDNHDVYLEIYKSSLSEFCIDENKLQICIPSAIWKIISKHKIKELSWAEKTDTDIENYVLKEVELRINKIKNPINRGNLSDFFCGSLIYGSPDESRDMQVESGIKYFSLKREQEINILNKYLKYKEINLKQ